MPEKGVEWSPHDEILRYEEILDLIGILWDLGVEKVRFTGGEPFVRKGFTQFLIEVRRRFPRLVLSLTTNGSLLEPYVEDLASISLAGLNVSLDTVNPEKFALITRMGRLENVIAGIIAARKAGIAPIKLNAVLIRHFNDTEIQALLSFAKQQGALLRLIEFMPLESGLWDQDRFISAEEVKALLPSPEKWIPYVQRERTSGPAQYYRNVETQDTIGLIAAVSHHFCKQCNRLRITARGVLKTCLFSIEGISLLSALRAGEKEEVRRLLVLAAKTKPEGWVQNQKPDLHMSGIGG